MKFYRKQPIEAEQFDGSEEMIDNYHVRCDTEYMLSDDPLEYSTVPYQMETLEGFLNINAGDWIVTGIDGEHWPIADDIFKKTYAELPVIPGNVAYVIKQAKNGGYKLGWVFHAAYLGIWRVSVGNWIRTHADMFAHAWLDGYVVEEEK